MRVYLDLCCLKRPFDEQGQPLVRLQTEAILSLLAAEASGLQVLRCAAHVLENSFNTVAFRREAVGLWLTAAPLDPVPSTALGARVEQLQALGFGSFDSVHLASAELAVANSFVTVDHRLLNRALRVAGELRVRVVDPLVLAEEVFRDRDHQ